MEQLKIKHSECFLEGLYKVSRSTQKQNCKTICLINQGDYKDLSTPVVTYSERVFSQLSQGDIPVVLLQGDYSLSDGDFVYIDPTVDTLLVVFYATSKSNNLFLTSRCSNNCIMCSQPPQNDRYDFFDIAMTIVRNAEAPEMITITGGEPTLFGNKFAELLAAIKEFWPSTYVSILTNGKHLSSDIINSINSVEYDRGLISFGIPLHSDIAAIHDKIAGVSNSFYATVKGLLSLSPSYYFIELRIVVQKDNAQRLPCIVDYVSRNLPFVGRIVLMQLEPEGHARANWEQIWVPVSAYADKLEEAICLAESCGIVIQLYNYQDCVLPDNVRKFACHSISDWKNIYIPTCLHCAKKNQCCGFFSSQDEEKYRNHITPLEV